MLLTPTITAFLNTLRLSISSVTLFFQFGISTSDKTPTAYVLIPVQQEQAIAQTNTVEQPQMPTADQVNSSLYEPATELNQDMESSESFQANELTLSEDFSGTSEQYD